MTKRNLWITGIAFSAMVVVFIAAFHGSKDQDVATKRIITPATTRSQPAPPPAAVAAPAPVPDEPSEPRAVTAPEPRKEVTYEEAEVAFHERDYDLAVDLFTMYTDLKSDNPWGFYMLGLSAWKAEDYETAEKGFERALALNPGHVKSWLNLSRVLLDTGRPAEALTKLEEAAAIEPESNTAYRLRGRAHHQLGQKEEAVAAYRRAIQIDDQDTWSMNNMALIFIEQGLFEEALPPLARATELKDNVAVFFNNLGMALECTGQFQAAETAYGSALAIDETYEKAAANLNRVEPVFEEPGLAPVDLAVLAQAFVDEIKSWGVAATGDQQPGSSDPLADGIVVSDAGVSPADSTGNGRDQ